MERSVLVEEIANGGDESVYFDSSDCGSSVYISDEEEEIMHQAGEADIPSTTLVHNHPALCLAWV